MATKTPDLATTNRHFQASETLDDGDHLDLNPGTQGLDSLEVHNINHGNDCDVKLRVDSNDDGTFDREITLDSFSGNGVSQGNEIEVLSDGNVVLRVTDTSSGSGNDYILTGDFL